MDNLTSVLNPDSSSTIGGPPILTNLVKSFIGISFSIVITWGIIGNSSVCYIVLKDLKLSVTNLFLLNLSLADILMAIFCGPFVMLNDFILSYWSFGLIMCKLMTAVQGVSCFVSAFTHIVISIDRFIVVYYPLKQRIRQRSAVYILISIWTLSVTMMSPLPYVYHLKYVNNTSYCQEKWDIFIVGNYSSEVKFDKGNYLNMIYTIFLLILQFFIPLLVIVSTYSAIAFRVWIQRTPGEGDVNRDRRIAKSKRKLLKMVILVAVLYGLSKLPRHVFFLASLQYSTMWTSPYSLYFLYIWVLCILADLSSIGYNPLIYCWMNKLFRRGFIRICLFLLPCCAKQCLCFRNILTKNFRNDRTTYCMSSTYDKPIASNAVQHRFVAVNASYKTQQCNVNNIDHETAL